MRRYETVVIADPDLSEEQRVPLFERMKEIINQEGGLLIETDEWGSRKLAYEIKNKPRGYYVRLEYCGMGPLVDELERFYRIDDRVLKFMTILLEKEADLDAVKARMAEAEAAEAKAAEEAENKVPAESTEKTASETEGESESAPASSDTETAPAAETAETKEEV